MNRFFFLICLIISFALITSVNIPSFSLEEDKFQWSAPLRISDPGYTPFSGPVFSVINPDHIIFAYTQTPFLPPEYKNINVYVRELHNGILSQSINLDNSIYNSLLFPTIKTNGNGITHLIWGRAIRNPSASSRLHPSDVYYSYCSNGSWSLPESIYHKDTIAVNSAYNNGRLDLDPNDRSHLLWIVNDVTTIGYYFCHNVEDNNSWGETENILFRSADFDFVFDKNGRLHLAYFRPVAGRFYDENSVFYRYSDDYGKTWSDSVLVQKSGSQRAIKVQVLLDHKNNIHILWTKNIAGNTSGGEAILHSFSSDGINWIKPIDAVPRSNDGFLYFSAAIDKNEKIHLVYDLWKGFTLPPVKICYTYCDGNNWSAPEDIIYDAEWPSLEFDDSGYLHLMYVNIINGAKYYTRSIKPLITTVDKKKVIPDNFELYQNYPNPFNPETSIEYRVGSMGHVSLTVYDLHGREIAVLVNEYQPEGVYNYRFSANELKLSSGVYFYQLKAGAFIDTKKFVLLK